MLPRILRVTRAKALKKTASAQKSDRPARQGSEKKGKDAVYNPKLSSERQSLQGRAARLLGKAGAAQLKGRDEHDDQANKRIAGIAKSPEDIVLEGYRATPKSGRPKDLKFGKAGGAKRKADPRSKSRKRASDWKKKGASAAK
jgi:nucleolar protein 12